MKASKASELRTLTDAELEVKLKEAMDHLFKLRLNYQTRQLEDTVSLRFARREVSRIKTLLSEKKSKTPVVK